MVNLSMMRVTDRFIHDIVQALYDMTSHKLQQKLFYLFCTPEGTHFDM